MKRCPLSSLESDKIQQDRVLCGMVLVITLVGRLLCRRKSPSNIVNVLPGFLIAFIPIMSQVRLLSFMFSQVTQMMKK